MSSPPSSEAIKKRSSRHRDRELILVVPRWTPVAATLTVVALLALAFAAGRWALPPRPEPLAVAAPDPALAPEPAPAPAPEPAPVNGAEPVFEPEPPSAVTPPEEPPLDRPPPAGRWGVQVGAFESRAEAEAKRAALDWVEQPSFVLGVDLEGRGRWYRLRVGAFERKARAEALAGAVRRRTGTRPLVVQYP